MIDWSRLLAILNRGSSSGQNSSINSIWDLLNDNAPASSENQSAGNPSCSIDDAKENWRDDIEACSSSLGDYWACRQEANDYFEMDVCKCDSRWKITWNAANTGYSMSWSSSNEGQCDSSAPDSRPSRPTTPSRPATPSRPTTPSLPATPSQPTTPSTG